MKVKYDGSAALTDLITPLELSDGFWLYYEGGAGDRHRVRLSRRLRGAIFDGTLEDVLAEFRFHRRALEGGGVLQMAFWLVDSRSTSDTLTGGNDAD